MASKVVVPLEVRPAPYSVKDPTLPPNFKPTALSIDITNTCTLKCKHCFWDSYEHLSCPNPNLLQKIKKLKQQMKHLDQTNIPYQILKTE